ncbi:pilus assembly protein PilO [uncultured Clostridium sp.]|uniref:pilus assembly protein PilO n=1 Tax=uncultured Clostridium sp. TaxID=59620 RepID=UPI0028E2DD62|nr:pilus assembly protein PilO [uncultured Clostridium sp.]
MRISNREKIMLYILGIIVIGFGYYQFVYSYQLNIIEDKAKKENDIEQKYNTAMNTINSFESKKSDMKMLKAKINDETQSFYPAISEEHIILELDDLLKDSGLDGGIKFNPVVSDSVEVKDEKNETLSESSMEKMVDEYKNAVDGKNANSNKDEKSAASSENSNNSSKQSNNENNTNNISNSNTNGKNTNDSNASESKNSKKKVNTVQYVKAEIDFQGNYNDLNKFLNKIENNEYKRKIVVNSINIDEDTLESVKGKINIEVYAVPKIDDDLEKYLQWDLNNVYGKSIPFDKGAASGNVEINRDNNDFEASIKSISSDMPTVTLGKVSDNGIRENSVYADSNSKEEVELVLTQDGDKYYYKYKTAKSTFPVNYDGLGTEFIPRSNNIVLDVLSEARIDSNDSSEINLKLVNKTNKLVEVEVTGDDTADPRLTIEGDGNISVNKK